MNEETKLELMTVSEDLADADRLEKAAKKRKERARGQFLKLATKALIEERPLKKESITITKEEFEAAGVTAGTEWAEAVEKWRLKNRAEWKVLNIIACYKGLYSALVTLEEDPDLMKFTFINPDTLDVVGRTTSETGAFYNAEGLYSRLKHLRDTTFDKDECEFYDKLLESIQVETKLTYTLDQTYAQLLMSVHPKSLPIFQQFAHPGTLSTKLTPIRKAKEEEVE